MVNGKKYPYTKSGMKAAASAKKRRLLKNLPVKNTEDESWQNVDFMQTSMLKEKGSLLVVARK